MAVNAKVSIGTIHGTMTSRGERSSTREDTPLERKICKKQPDGDRRIERNSPFRLHWRRCEKWAFDGVKKEGRPIRFADLSQARRKMGKVGVTGVTSVTKNFTRFVTSKSSLPGVITFVAASFGREEA